MPAGTQLIAPCDMNCGICQAYLREKRKCPGCYGEDINKSITKVNCIIRNCKMVKLSQSGFCYECIKYPCKRLQQLDKRYTTKYAMSMIENPEYIKENSLSTFVEKENERWRCSKCGGVIYVHRGYCFHCGERPN